jgi:hypothetical protein
LRENPPIANLSIPDIVVSEVIDIRLEPTIRTADIGDELFASHNEGEESSPMVEMLEMILHPREGLILTHPKEKVGIELERLEKSLEAPTGRHLIEITPNLGSWVAQHISAIALEVWVEVPGKHFPSIDECPSTFCGGDNETTLQTVEVACGCGKTNRLDFCHISNVLKLL